VPAMLLPAQAKHSALLLSAFVMGQSTDSNSVLSVSSSQLFALEYNFKDVTAVYCGKNYSVQLM